MNVAKDGWSMKDITEPGPPTGDGDVFFVVIFSTRSSGKTDTIAAISRCLKVTEARRKGEKDE